MGIQSRKTVYIREKASGMIAMQVIQKIPSSAEAIDVDNKLATAKHTLERLRNYSLDPSNINTIPDEFNLIQLAIQEVKDGYEKLIIEQQRAKNKFIRDSKAALEIYALQVCQSIELLAEQSKEAGMELDV